MSGDIKGEGEEETYIQYVARRACDIYFNQSMRHLCVSNCDVLPREQIHLYEISPYHLRQHQDICTLPTRYTCVFSIILTINKKIVSLRRINHSSSVTEHIVFREVGTTFNYFFRKS
jgi:hypothetical protein